MAGSEKNERNERTRRRLACEFVVEGQRYRGITLDLSLSGLFIQTDATVAPGADIQIELTGGTGVPRVALRGVVARRRSVPAPLAQTMPRGLGVLLLEIPEAYGRMFHSGAEVAEPRAASAPGAAPAPAAPSPKPAAEMPRPRPEPAGAGSPAAWPSPAPGREKRRGQPAAAPRTPSSEPVWRPDVLLIDDGELEEIAELLRQLGATVVRQRSAESRAPGAAATPRRLLIASARIILSQTRQAHGGEDGVVSIAVADDDSQTLATRIRRLGYRYLVCRPHPEALRVLLAQALHQRGNHRAAPRFAFGIEVSWRAGFRRRHATLLDMSSDGCRLLTSHSAERGSAVTLALPADVTGGRRLTLEGRIVRQTRRGSPGGASHFSVAIAFGDLPARTRRQLDTLLLQRALGPAPMTRAAKTIEPVKGGDRRERSRGVLDREIVALDRRGTAIATLVGRDLSVRGLRVDPDHALRLGQRLRIALCDPNLREPLSLDVEVARDDGDRGWLLRFANPATAPTAQIEAIVAALPRAEALRKPQPIPIALGSILRRRPAA